MSTKSDQFIKAVFGDSAEALIKSVSRRPEMAPFLLPRIVVAWVKTLDSFDGHLPGIPNSDLALQKNEAGFGGYLRVGANHHNIQDGSEFHVAALVLSVLGVSDLKKSDVTGPELTRLGAAVDALLEKALKDIPPSNKVARGGGHDYSHLLSPALKGYSLIVRHHEAPHGLEFQANVFHGGRAVGSLVGGEDRKMAPDTLQVHLSDLDDDHRGKGLGQAMYEAAFKHANDFFSIDKVMGDKHSTAADKVHRKLAAKHGWDYVPKVVPGKEDKKPSDYDERFQPYSYVLKEELGKGALDPNAGYKINHKMEGLPGSRVSTVTAHAPSGEVVGFAKFAHTGPHLKSFLVNVDEDHQRKGLATAMYDHAEQNTGKKILPSDVQTDEGKAFSASRKTQKAELPGQPAKPQKQLNAIPPVPPTKQPRRVQTNFTKSDCPPHAIVLSKSQAQNQCRLCGGQFVKNEELTGCICIEDVLNQFDVKKTESEYVLVPKPKVSAEEVLAVRKTLT